MAVTNWDNYKKLRSFINERIIYCTEMCLERADKLGLDKGIAIMELVNALSCYANTRTYESFKKDDDN